MTNKAIGRIKLWWKKYEDKLFYTACILTIVVWLVNLGISVLNLILLECYG